MSENISKTLNYLLTTTMLVILLIACERMPETQTLDNQPSYNFLDDSQSN
jgi:uncharacterized membrane protein YdcZ (DUF606 family)